jgi:hypothetical protein
MSYYENNFFEENMENFNNLEEGYDNADNFYYLTENEQSVAGLGLNDNIYEEDNYVEHMENQRQVQVAAEQSGLTGPNVQVPIIPVSKVVKSKKSKKSAMNWLYVLVIILVISLIAYYLIDSKIIKLPSFGSSTSTSSPTSSTFRATLGSTFMSLH